MNQDLGSNLANWQTAVERRMLNGYYLETDDIVQIRAYERNGEEARLDYLDFTPVNLDSLNYSNSVVIQAEDYTSYWDKWSGNEGNSNYRNDDVDIESGGTGLNIGHIYEGEWLAYETGNIAGTRDVLLRVASNSSASKTIDLTVHGRTYTSGSVTSTGGWQQYEDLIVSNVEFGTGGDLRLDFNNSGLNLDYIEII